jgi:5-methylthioadenosine/S-adenosylhomocysteine deaminase
MQTELLIHADWVLPVDADDSTLEQHSLAIADGRIAAILPRAQAEAQISAAKTWTCPATC